MIPSKSNLSKESCSPISSNCVVWQGPDIQCINLCTGDTISDVTYKLATELCDLKQQLDLTDLDLTCIVNVCSDCQVCEPEKMLATVLQLLVDKVCCLNDIVLGITPTGPYSEPILNLPLCLQYVDDGQLVTQLIHHEYTLRLANFICSLNTTVNNHTTQINNLTSAVTTIQQWKITPSCSYPPTVPSSGVATPLLTLIEAFEDKMCQLSTILGSVTQIQTAIDAICDNLNTQTSLSNPPTQMQNLTGWNASPTTLAESIENLWITVCDIRDYVQYCDCAPSGASPCEDVDLSSISSTSTVSSSGVITVTVDYTGIFLPVLTTNCAGNAVVRISDTNGNIFISSVNLTTITGTVDYVLPLSFIPGSPLTVDIEYCFNIDGIPCEGTYTTSPDLPCPELQSINVYLSNPVE
jgi:hypothetical protein